MTKRTGTIEWRNGWAFARVWVGEERKRIRLNTRDKATAARMLAKVNRMIARGELTPESDDDSGAEEFRPFAEQWVDKREEEGVKMAPDERINLTKHVYDVAMDRRTFGDLAILDIRPRHIVAVLQAAIDKGLSKGTVEHIKRMLSRICGAAIAAEILAPGTSPVTNAKTPRIPDGQRVKKRRAVLTDAEIVQFFECRKLDLEIRMMGMVARVEGGMRTSDVNRWDWTHIDTRWFLTCKIPRSKVDRGPQDIEIPEMLRPFLAGWWHESGRPTSGPVFPVTKGPRKGQARAVRGVSFAGRLRKALRLAGLTRPELFNETEHTLPVDFHSFRRAFVTAVAESGVNQQRAMTLSHHSDAKTHQGYLAQTPLMRTIPESALPKLNAGNLAEQYPARDNAPDTALQVPENGAGNGIRTRDPQLGKLRDASIRAVARDSASSEVVEAAPCGVRIHSDDTHGVPTESIGVGDLDPPLVVVIGAPTVAPIEARDVPGVKPSDAETFGELMAEAMDPAHPTGAQ